MRCLTWVIIYLYFLLAGIVHHNSALRPDGQITELEDLKSWLNQPLEKRSPLKEQTWANAPLTKTQAQQARALLWQDHLKQWRAAHKEEWETKLIKLDDKTMKFDYKVFGDDQASGRSLYISMHGGGHAPSRVNDQQWRNQLRLYQPKEGVYLAPRAPTDAWNMWFQPHMDQFFDRLIQDAVAFLNVDSNRVYLLGYSAGGDGVYQMAPRMADHWAAAAMMAGHPNDASPVNLRNVPFCIHVGANDTAFNRNKIAAEWGQKLDLLQMQDPKGYIHQVQVHKNRSHWMNLEDAVAIPWMSQYQRNPAPKQLVWRQAMRARSTFYWLSVSPEEHRPGDEIHASIDGQTVKIESTGRDLKQTHIWLSDSLVQLDQPIQVLTSGDRELFQGKGERKIIHLFNSLEARGDLEFCFPVQLTLNFKNDG